jgi:hypothetical protein
MAATRMDPSVSAAAPKLLTAAELGELMGISYCAATRFIRCQLEPSDDSPVVYLGPHAKRVRLDRYVAWIEARTGRKPNERFDGLPTPKRIRRRDLDTRTSAERLADAHKKPEPT